MFKIVNLLDTKAEMNFLPAKPKHMHRQTYERLVARYDAYAIDLPALRNMRDKQLAS